MTNLLFVCSRNQWRSPTGERHFKQQGYDARSAGTSPNARHSISARDIQWADVIFPMENKHRNIIVARFGRLVTYKKIHVLDIPDDYAYMDPELIDLLSESVDAYLKQPRD